MQPSQPLQPDRLVMTVQDDRARLDRVVADWRGLSRSAVLRLLEQGAVMCNGRVMRRSDKGGLLRVGDRLVLEASYAQGEVPRPDATLVLNRLAAGDGWLVVNKPAGVPVRPHALDEVGTVLNAVAHAHPEVVGVGEGGLRSGVVHRLDNDTSGALLIATQQAAWERFRSAFAEHRIEKRYVALVHGVPNEVGSLRRDLAVAAHRPARVTVYAAGQGGPGARTCSLGWQVMERFGDRASLVEVDLHTGFLHQVRVMMNDLGHPVIGDAAYGDQANDNDAPRQMLHAKSLRLDGVLADAPLPEDMQQVMAALA